MSVETRVWVRRAIRRGHPRYAVVVDDGGRVAGAVLGYVEDSGRRFPRARVYTIPRSRGLMLDRADWLDLDLRLTSHGYQRVSPASLPAWLDAGTAAGLRNLAALRDLAGTSEPSVALSIDGPTLPAAARPVRVAEVVWSDDELA